MAETPPTSTGPTHEDVAGKKSPSERGVPIDGDSDKSLSRVWLIGGAVAALVLLLVVVVSLSGRDPSNTTANASQTPGVASPQDEPGSNDGTQGATKLKTTTDSPTSDSMVAAASDPVTFSMRPVLGEFAVSPALTEPVGDHPPNLDPETGITMTDDVSAEAYLKNPETGIIYWVGPAFVTGSDIRGGEAVLTSGQWTVVPEFTDDGGHKFREATGSLAMFPPGSPQRQLAIVVDGVVLSAPAVADEVVPGEGLDPSAVIITVGASATPEQDAESLALAFRSGS